MIYFVRKRFELLFSVAGLIFLSILPIWILIPSRSWHDWQRMGQILFIASAAIFGSLSGLFKNSPHFLERRVRYVIVVIAGLGLLSALQSRQPYWAFVEWSVFAGSLCLGWVMIALQQHFQSKDSDRVLLAAVFSVCTLLSVRFFIYYCLSIANRDEPLDYWILIDGFSNPRFFGQFCSLTLPLLAIPLLEKETLGHFSRIAAPVFFLWWLQVILSGTRGTWLGMAVAITLMALLGRTARRWATMQCLGIAGGLALYFIFLKGVPDLLGMDIQNSIGSRLTTSLSSRELLWQQAFHMMTEKPWLGFGPMHFADIPNPAGAHPHQAILQWASEWGIPSTLLVMTLAGYGLWRMTQRVRKQQADTDRQTILYICLGAAIVASLTQSMVDGVFVMPYTELWFTLVSAWLISTHHRGLASMQSNENPIFGSFAIANIAFLFSAAILCFALAQSLAAAWGEQKPHAPSGHRLRPGFWEQGIIATPDDSISSHSKLPSS